MNERIKATIRIIALFVTAINAVLAVKGIKPLPFDESIVYDVCSQIAFGLAAIWAWWKNNNVTQAAITGQQVVNSLKAQKGVFKDYEKEGIEIIEDKEV